MDADKCNTHKTQDYYIYTPAILPLDYRYHTRTILCIFYQKILTIMSLHTRLKSQHTLRH